MSGRSTITGVVLAALIVLAAGGLALDGAARTGRLGGAVRYAPAAGVPRPAGIVMHAREMLSARDFDVAGPRLFVLDPLRPAVHELRLGESGWSHQASFGRRGGGPGEFSTPTGIAVLRAPERLAVIEPGRIHFFDLDGRYLESVAPELPCALPLPRIGSAARGLFVHGNCLYRGAAADTMMAVLFWSADGRAFRLAASDARYSVDGRFGSAFGTESALAEGPAHLHAFGSGSTACVQVVEEGEGVPRTRRICDSALRLHRLELSARTRERVEAARRRSPVAASALRLPPAHPPYAQLLVDGSGVALLRGWSEDSVVLRRFASQQDLAVLPRDGLVGCRRGGCLYARPAESGVTLVFHPASTLQSPR